MNISDINTNLPCLRVLRCSATQKRRMSCSTNSKSTHSSSSTQSKSVNLFPVLIQLCIYPNEEYAYQTMKILFSSRKNYSPNVCDEFGCNVLMYTLRYQRYQLFHFLLNEISSDLNLRSKDRQGNTILHYAIIYGKKDTQIFDHLIQKFNKFGINIDERNIFGFTPLLLASFSGRYDLVLTLLTKTDASPFVRDYIQSKNILDYLNIDTKHQQLIQKLQNSDQSPCSSRKSTRLRIQLHQTLPSRLETPHQKIVHHAYRNFFETVLPEAVQDRSGLIRSAILKMFDIEYFSTDLTNLIHYINRRYPRIKTPRKQDTYPHMTTPITTKLVFQRENSKTSVHRMINLFDPHFRPKAIPPKPPTVPNLKTPITFKRLGTKLTVLAALSRPQTVKKPVRSITTIDTK